MLDAVNGHGVGNTVIAPAPARPYVRELGSDPVRCASGSSITTPGASRSTRRARRRRVTRAGSWNLSAIESNPVSPPCSPTALAEQAREVSAVDQYRRFNLVPPVTPFPLDTSTRSQDSLADDRSAMRRQPPTSQSSCVPRHDGVQVWIPCRAHRTGERSLPVF